MAGLLIQKHESPGGLFQGFHGCWHCGHFAKHRRYSIHRTRPTQDVVRQRTLDSTLRGQNPISPPMAKLKTKIEIYDPGTRANRIHNATAEGPELVIDALERDQSCLDMQILAEAAASAKSGMIVLTVKVEKLRR